MKQFYIGTRSDWNTMSAVAESSVAKLNPRMSETIRSAAMKQGIKKTQDRKKLEFYLVSEEQFKKLTSPATATLVALKHGKDWHPLIAVDKDIMTDAIQKVNAKYGNRMPRDVFAKYNAELQTAVESAVVKLAEDKKLSRPKHYNNQNIKVGDIIREGGGWRTTCFSVVTKVTEHSYSYKVYEPVFNAYGLFLNKSSEELARRGILIQGANSQDGDIKVPFKGNEDLFQLSQKAKTKRFTRYEITVYNDDAEYNHYWYCD
jgi:hypothetical protein